jgi:citrate synthase
MSKIRSSAICHVTANRIEVRGRDLCNDLMGRLTFTEYFFFLVTGHLPTEKQRYFLDLLLVTIAEHGLAPSVQAARMTYSADPDALHAAVAAGVLGCGPVILGTADVCAKALNDARQRIDAGISQREAAYAVLREVKNRGERAPGFGHPIHHPVDPRVIRMLELLDEQGTRGIHVTLAEEMAGCVEEIWGKPMPMNASMLIAAVLLDFDFPPAIVKSVPVLGRVAGLLGHLTEEKNSPLGFFLAAEAEKAVTYSPPQ